MEPYQLSREQAKTITDYTSCPDGCKSQMRYINVPFVYLPNYGKKAILATINVEYIVRQCSKCKQCYIIAFI